MQQRFMTHFRSDAEHCARSVGRCLALAREKGTPDRAEQSRYLDIADALAGRRPAVGGDRAALLRPCGSDFNYEILVANS